MANKLLGEEEIIVGKDHYLFCANFRFLADLKDALPTGPMAIFNALSTDEDASPEHIKQVFCCSLKTVNGKEVSADKMDEVVEEFITLNGMEMSWVVAQHMLSYAMIGDVKKSEIQELEKKRMLLEKLTIFRSASSRSQLSLWVYRLVIFGTFVCSSFSLISLLTLHNLDLMKMVKILIGSLLMN